MTFIPLLWNCKTLKSSLMMKTWLFTFYVLYFHLTTILEKLYFMVEKT